LNGISFAGVARLDLSHEERERLKRYGLTLEDISPATLLKRRAIFTRPPAGDRTTLLNRPLALEDDSEK